MTRTPPTGTLSPDEQKVARARIVADHWRRAALDMDRQQTETRIMAHPLCCVLAALDGESDPAQLGVSLGADYDLLQALREDTCEHEWVSMRNIESGGPIESGELCVRCNAVRASA